MLLAAIVLPALAGAQELAGFVGITDTDDHSHTTYAWQLQFRQLLTPHDDIDVIALGVTWRFWTYPNVKE